MDNTKQKEIVDGIINTINTNTFKIKIVKPLVYPDSLNTAISNSNITKFYKRYYAVFFKKYKSNIPFPNEKITPNIRGSLDRLNDLIKIYQNYEGKNFYFGLAKLRCMHLLDLVLYDLYFDIKTENLYQIILSLEIPNETELKNVSLSIIPIISNNGIIDEHLFYILSENIVNFIVNFDFNKNL